LRNYDQPLLDINYLWFWSLCPSKKAPSIILSDDLLTVSREPLKGMNPLILTKFPLTKKKNQFQIIVKTLGNWIGIGVGESQLLVENGKTLGTQSKCINSSYFFQNTGIRRIQMYGEKSIDTVKSIESGDIIDIKIDFTTNRIIYFNNGQLQGWITPHKPLIEGILYPCVNFSCEVIFFIYK
jgi:hypothetical protein